MPKTGSNKSGKTSSKSTTSKGKSSKSATPSKGVVNPSKPSVDTHKGSHDTPSIPNKTLTENGANILGHNHPKFTGDQLSEMGKDKELGKLYARKYKNKK